MGRLRTIQGWRKPQPFYLTADERAAIEWEIERLIASLDLADGDPDLEPEEDADPAHDDGCGPIAINGRIVWGCPGRRALPQQPASSGTSATSHAALSITWAPPLPISTSTERANMADTSTTRRALFGSAGIAIVVATAPALASAFPAETIAISPGLSALISAVRVRDGMVERHQVEVLDIAVGKDAILAAVAENNALNDAYADALDAVATHPVSTVADLRAKLAFMLENDMGDGRDWLDEINADVLRIASGGGR